MSSFATKKKDAKNSRTRRYDDEDRDRNHHIIYCPYPSSPSGGELVKLRETAHSVLEKMPHHVQNKPIDFVLELNGVLRVFM